MGLFIGEAAGARILRCDTGRTDVTAEGTQDVLLDLECHDNYPGGETADLVFRSCDLAIKHDSGFALMVTPILDGVSQPPQSFSGTAPPAGQDGGAEPQAFIAQRGTRLAIHAQQTAATGDVQILDLTTSFVLIRVAP